MKKLSCLSGAGHRIQLATRFIRASVAYLLFACSALMDASAQCLRWDSGVGTQLVSRVWTLAAYDDGSGNALYLGGDSAVAKWSGQGWVWDADFDNQVAALAVFDDGSGAALYATGEFQIAQGSTARLVARRLGPAHWVEFGNGLPSLLGSGGIPRSLAVYDGGGGPCLFVGGTFTTYGSIASPSLVKWNGSSWSGVGGGLMFGSFAGTVKTMCTHDDGTGIALYVGGWFDVAGGTPVSGIAKWDGTAWAPLASGVRSNGAAGYVFDMVEYDDGSGPSLYVCGIFDHAGGVPVSSLARWTHGVWSALPGAPQGSSFSALGVFDDGDGPALYLGTSGTVMKWKSGELLALGGTSIGGDVDSLHQFDDGQGGGVALYAGGHFSFSGSPSQVSWNVARWRGCQHDVDSMCFGDGTFTSCPCANYGTFGHGCRNSASTAGAELTFTGGTHPDTLFLTSANELPTSLSLFLQSATLSSTPITFGDGIRCLGGHLQRMYVKHAAAGTVHAPEGGDQPITTRSAQLGDPITPGTVRYYQVWYRDGSPSYCSASSFNISNGLRAVW